ncbi:MAG: alpha/beta hydrolase-fold protein, partial [Nonlabens sp.]|nr:alpha/beta hydrolase-fold protein [Nonlabens sp.]
MRVFFFITFFISLGIQAQQVRKIDLETGFKDQTREILVRVPDGYNTQPDKKYEVIYVFDAQGDEYFELVYSSLDFMRPAGTDFIVVGVPSPYYSKDYNRFHDLLPPSKFPETKIKYGEGNAPAFLNFVDSTVVKHVEENYRTAPTRIAVGHSNGGAFLMYTLLERPELFDAFIALSPNFAFDQEQLNDRIREFDPRTLPNQKYIFMSSANETDDTGWPNWQRGRENAYRLLREPNWQECIHLTVKAFPNETHSSTYPIGVITGFSDYFRYLYFDYKQLKDYVDKMYLADPTSIDAEELNGYAYNLQKRGQVDNAIKLLLYANKLFPTDLEITLSIGDLYRNKADKKRALEYYNKYAYLLERQQKDLDDSSYRELKRVIELK